MNDIQKRFALFLIGCIGLRLFFVYLAKSKQAYLPYFGAFALLPGIGFLYIFATDTRKTGAEVFGDEIWWNNLRPVHGLLYLLFGVLALQKKSYSWLILLIDVCVGLTSFLIYHSAKGNFTKLIN